MQADGDLAEQNSPTVDGGGVLTLDDLSWNHEDEDMNVMCNNVDASDGCTMLPEIPEQDNTTDDINVLHDGGDGFDKNGGGELMEIEAFIGCEGSEVGGGRSGENEEVMKKGPWTTAEDSILIKAVKEFGSSDWVMIEKYSGLGRTSKSCRLRWTNHLKPNLKKGAFTPEEVRLIIKLHYKNGNKWSRIAKKLPGRTDNEIKNFWHSMIKKCKKRGLPLYPDWCREDNQTDDNDRKNFISTTSTVEGSATNSSTIIPPPSPSFPSFQNFLSPRPKPIVFSSAFNSCSFNSHRPPPLLTSQPAKFDRFRTVTVTSNCSSSSQTMEPPISPLGLKLSPPKILDSSFVNKSENPSIQTSQSIPEIDPNLEEEKKEKLKICSEIFNTLLQETRVEESGSSDLQLIKGLLLSKHLKTKHLYRNILKKKMLQNITRVKAVLSRENSYKENFSNRSSVGGNSNFRSSKNSRRDYLLRKHSREVSMRKGEDSLNLNPTSEDIRLIERLETEKSPEESLSGESLKSKCPMNEILKESSTNTSSKRDQISGSESSKRICLRDEQNNSMPEELSSLLEYFPTSSLEFPGLQFMGQLDMCLDLDMPLDSAPPMSTLRESDATE